MNEEKRVVSIKLKLLVVIVPVVIVCIVMLVFMAYTKSSNLIENYSKELLESSVDNQTAQIEGWLNQNIEALQMIKTTIESTNPDDATLQKILETYYGYSSNYPEGIYIADETGKVWKASQSTLSDSNATNSVWFKEGLTRVNMAVGTPHINSQGENVISATGILQDDAKNIKVIAADMTLDRISIIVNSFIEMKDAQAMLVNRNDRTILASRDSDKISTVLGNSGIEFELAVSEKLKNYDYDFANIDGNMTVFKEIAGTDWILISYIPTSIVLSDIVDLRNVMVIISVISIVLLCIVIERITHIVIAPIRKLTSVIAALTEGDFTVSVVSKGNDEVAAMSRGVERFIETMKTMISSISSISEQLGVQADASDNVSKQMQDAAMVQSRSMGELNNTVDQLAVSVNEIAQNATKLANAVAEAKNESEYAGNKMGETVDVSKMGRSDMEKVEEALNSIQLSITNLSEAINKVGTASSEIVEIVKLIGSIADETNLLSLNASIEAARAGEAGRGFAVVASEIGKLAENSATSASHISSLIYEVNNLVKDAVQQATDSANDINNSSVLIHTAINTFDTIYDNIEQTSVLINEMLDNINDINEVAMTVAAISQQQAASSDEIFATSEAMLHQAENIARNSEHVAKESQSLTDSSMELEKQVKQFRI